MIIFDIFRCMMATNATTITHSLIDIGANLTHKSLKSNLQQILERAAKNQILDIIITGASLSGSREAIDIARKFNQQQQLVKLYSTVGIHPHEATRHSTFNYREQIVDLLEKNKTNKTIIFPGNDRIGQCIYPSRAIEPSFSLQSPKLNHSFIL